MAVVDHGLLRTIHRMHRQIADLSSRIERGPKQLKASTLKVKNAKETLDQLKDSVKRTQVLANEKQLLLKQREDKILDYQGKLNAAKSNDEFQAFKSQIAADEKANEVLSDEIFEQLEKIDSINSQIEEAKASLETAQKERDKIQEKIDTEAAGLESELTRVSSELTELEQQIPIEIKSDYTRVASNRGEDALAPVDGEVCGGCFRKITMMQHSDIAAAKPVFCKSCGALLYPPENTKV